MSCGVTVVTAVRKERKQKTGKEVVRQRPILYQRLQISRTTWIHVEREHRYHTVAVNHTSHNTNALRLNRSPNGHRNSRPAAYPACINVGTTETCS